MFFFFHLRFRLSHQNLLETLRKNSDFRMDPNWDLKISGYVKAIHRLFTEIPKPYTP